MHLTNKSGTLQLTAWGPGRWKYVTAGLLSFNIGFTSQDFELSLIVLGFGVTFCWFKDEWKWVKDKA